MLKKKETYVLSLSRYLALFLLESCTFGCIPPMLESHSALL